MPCCCPYAFGSAAPCCTYSACAFTRWQSSVM